MKTRILADNQHKTAELEVTVELKGNGDKVCERNLQYLTGLIDEFKVMKSEQEINDHYTLIMGYCLCCKNSGFIDEKGADDIMQMAAIFAGNKLAKVRGAKA